MKKENLEYVLTIKLLENDQKLAFWEVFDTLEAYVSAWYVNELKIALKWLELNTENLGKAIRGLKNTEDMIKLLKFDGIDRDIRILEVEEIKDILDNEGYEKPAYIWLSNLGCFYHLESWYQHTPQVVSLNLWIKQKELLNLLNDWVIKKYKEVYYGDKCPKDKYNLLDLKKIVKIAKVSENDIVGVENVEMIKKLVWNVVWNKKENIEWFEKAIWYKYNNINDSNIPGVILYWNGWTWKGLTFKMFRAMFGSSNVLDNLGQKDLLGDFNTYQWKKLIVEFAEISSYNTNLDKKALNTLKNLIWSDKITVNAKHEKQYEVSNIAWFFITSNNHTPIVLETNDKTNRRFSIMETWVPLEQNYWISFVEKIAKVVEDKKSIAWYLAYLEEKYGKEIERPRALVNIDKNNLIEKSKSDSVMFFESVWQKFAWKKVMGENIIDHFKTFCEKSWIDFNIAKRYIRKELPGFVSYKKMRIAGDQCYGFEFSDLEGEEYIEEPIKLENIVSRNQDLLDCM